MPGDEVRGGYYVRVVGEVYSEGNSEIDEVVASGSVVSSDEVDVELTDGLLYY